MPGAVVAPTRPVRTGTEPEVFVLGGMFMVICLLPLTIAYARRIWRRGATIIAPVPPDVRDRINQLSEAVESIGLQVERIGEGQRFITKVFTEQGSRAVAAGSAAPIPVPRRDVEP